MFSMSVPWWEFVLRGVVVYLFLLVFLRLSGKRQTGQYEPFDLILLLILRFFLIFGVQFFPFSH